MYNGELDNGNGDFVSVGMRESRVEFKFDVGSGPAIIMSDPVQLNDWHSIRVKRIERNGRQILYVKNTICYVSFFNAVILNSMSRI